VEAFDEATLRLRGQWNGHISLAITPLGEGPAVPPPVLSLDDPLAATIALLAPTNGFESRLVRGRPAAEDSAWAANGGSLILWPRLPGELSWPSGPIDTVGGVVSGDAAVVAAFARISSPPDGEYSAVWADGRPAATTLSSGRGCIRNVAVPVSETGDLALRPSFLSLTRELLASCTGTSGSVQAGDSLLNLLRGQSSLRPALTAGAAEQHRTPANRWLLVGAALVFALEPFVRRRRIG
jgi:hypothetical protein